MNFLRDWLVGVVAAALLTAVCEAMMLKSTVKKVGRLTAGLILTLAMLGPLVQLRIEDFSDALTRYRAEIGSYGETISEENRRLMRVIIEERSAAYVEERASAMGLSCTVTVTCRDGGEDYPYPYRAEVAGDLTDEERKTVRTILETELAVPAERVTRREESP